MASHSRPIAVRSAAAFAAKEDSRDNVLNIFLFNTTRQEKIDQLNAVARHRHLPILFMPVTDLGEPSHSPQELTGSFKHNKNTKLMSCAKHLSQFTYEQVKHAMEPHGISAADIDSGKVCFFACAEDSGFSFNRGGPERYAETEKLIDTFFNTGPHGPYTSDADKELVRGLERFSRIEIGKNGQKTRAPFPGVELSPVTSSAEGIPNFLRLLNLTMEHLGLPLDPRKVHNDKRVFIAENSVLGAFEWDPKHGQEFPRYLNSHPEIIKEGKGFSTSIYDGAHAEKIIKSDKEVTFWDVAIPKHMAARKQYVWRNDLHEIYQPPSRGNALGELVDALRIHSLKPRKWSKFIERQSYKLGAVTKDHPYAVSIIPGDESYPHTELRSRAREAVKNAGMGVSYARESEPGADPDHLPRLWNNINGFQDMIDKNDAIIFMPSGAEERLDKTRALEEMMAFAYFSIHKALDPAGKGKLGILLEHKQGDFDRLDSQMNALFNHGTLSERPSKIFARAGSIEEAVKMAEEHQMHYRPVIAKPQQDSDVPDMKDKTGKYNVCVFLSASMEGVFEDKAEALGKRIQAAGMALSYGAADRNMMGALLHGMVKAARKRKEEPSVIGATTHVIGTIENSTGEKPKEIPEDCFYLAPNITKRKEFLFKNSHAFIVLEGGAGTLDELIMYMYYKHNDPDMVKDKPMIISESAYTKGSMFQQTLDIFTGEDTSHLNEEARQRIYKNTGIMIMQPPTKIPEGSKKKLYQIEMDNAIEFLKEHRAEHYPHLVPNRDDSKWVTSHDARANSRESSALGHS